MTTKVKIEIVQHTQTLAILGVAAEEYMHSGQTLLVREMTTQEMHAAGHSSNHSAGGKSAGTQG